VTATAAKESQAKMNTTAPARHVPSFSSDGCIDIDEAAGTVHQRDCVDLMRAMPGNSVDMVFSDPPFNLNKRYKSYKDRRPFEEYLEWTSTWVKEAVRVLKPSGSIFIYNIPKILTYTSAMLNEVAEFRHWIAWNANGRPLGKSLQPAHYGILFYTKTGNYKFYDVRAPHKRCRVCAEYLKDYGGKSHLRHKFGYQVSDVWDDIHRVRHNCRRIEEHPCQLPVPLIERMILMTTDENDIVLDIFAGAGTAAVAARQMGRRYIGAEIDGDYCAAARGKLERARPVKEGGAYVSVYLKKVVSMRDVD